MFSDCGNIIFLLLLVQYIESAHRLNEYISHYEPLSYDHEEVHKNHLRVRRSVTQPDNAVHLSFQAHGRDFRLRLKRDVSTFSDQLEVLGPSGALQVDTAHIYHGHLIGEPDSSVFGSIVDGVFEGKIVSPTGSFYVEKARHYFPPHQNFHSVIYNENHVEDPYQHKRQGHGGGCGITDDVRQWMDRIKNAAVDTDLPPIPVQKKTLKEKTKSNASQGQQPTTAPPPSINVHDNPHDKYNREVNKNEMPHEKSKRAIRNWSTCSLYIRTDPFIWKHIREGIPEHKNPTKELEVREKTTEEILSLIAHHVAAINYIYSSTKFDGRSEHRNIQFEVQRIEIDDDSSCRCKVPYNCEVDQFCMENINVTNFLKMFSLENHEDFCLAYLFTYRDFAGGILSLAWEASASGASGGICDKFKTHTIRGMYQPTKRSLNTGIITLVNYNSRVPPKVSQLTFAHAIGHNFGSPHDYPNDCQPGGPYGNFLMFAFATSGDRPNNSKFSTCSVGNISSVLDAIDENRKRNCFTVSAGSFCGNQIVEAGEECDCGYDNFECNDRCCYPRILDIEDRAANGSAKGCSRRVHTQCSPSQGPCCNSDTCKFVAKRSKTVCKRESDCSWSSTCNGRSSECPTPKSMPNKACNNGTRMCINGECSGSICLAWNLTECFLTSNNTSDIDKKKLCELACQNGTDPSTCRSTSEFAHRVGLPSGGISLTPGSPCGNFRGYCDVFLKCQAVDVNEPTEPAAK